MTRRTVSPLVVKEIRALLPAWLACLAAMAICAGTTLWPFGEMGIGAYLIGVAALGGLSIGHEYGHRTLPLLLVQPVRRERLLSVKLGVLTVMLAGIAAAASVVVLPRVDAGPSIRLAFFLLPLVGLCVAPWLTMVFGSTMAGTVFTLALPGTLLTISELLYLAIFRRYAPGSFQELVLWRGTIACCVLGAVMGWRTFLRLEAIEGPGASLDLTAWLPWARRAHAAAPALTRRAPLRLLVAKELRLQKMPFVVAGLYGFGWIAAALLQRAVAHSREIFDIFSVFYVILIALLIGAVASAEERQMGTLAWQQLLPVTASKQWAVKVAVVLSLSILLAVAMPALLVSLPFPMRLVPQIVFAVVALAACGLYVSSVSISSVWAMLLSMPAVFGVVWLIQIVRGRLAPMLGREYSISLVRTNTAGEPLMAGAFIVLLLWLAFQNHRSAERGGRRFCLQGVWLTAYLTAATVAAVWIGR